MGDEERVIAMREAKLIGKTVTGTLQMTGNNRIKYWIKWNNRRCDNIYVPHDVIAKFLGEKPVAGTTLECKITELGPDTATAWRKHPQCEELKVVKTFTQMVFSRTRPNRPRFVNSKLSDSKS